MKLKNYELIETKEMLEGSVCQLSIYKNIDNDSVVQIGRIENGFIKTIDICGDNNSIILSNVPESINIEGHSNSIMVERDPYLFNKKVKEFRENMKTKQNKSFLENLLSTIKGGK